MNKSLKCKVEELFRGKCRWKEQNHHNYANGSQQMELEDLGSMKLEPENV